MADQDVRDSIDAAAAQLVPVISGAQAAYRNTHNRYAQLLPTHTTPPADGAYVAPDNLAARPSYQDVDGEVLANLAGLPATMQCSCSCDQYTAYAGQGFVLRMEVVLSGVLWRRLINFGPEPWRSQEWAAVPTGPMP